MSRQAMSRQAIDAGQTAAFAAAPSEQAAASSAERDTLIGSTATTQRGVQTDVAAPASIGKYAVIGRLDGGGQADVLRAVHPALEKEVVIKLARRLGAECSFDPQRLIDEGKVLADLNHPHIARIFDLDFHDGQPFLVMEFVRGQNLAQYAASRSPRPREIATLLAKIARGVGVAHSRGVLHRDLKPANILIDERGEPRIIDFGLADIRHAWGQSDRPRSVSGTAPYMAPEQARGEMHRVDERSDVFALGAVLYFLLAGKAPFAGRDPLDSLMRAAECRFDHAALRRRHVDQGLARICFKAMSATPEDRYRTANDMAAALERLARRRIRVRRLVKSAAVLAPLAIMGVLVTNSMRDLAQERTGGRDQLAMAPAQRNMPSLADALRSYGGGAKLNLAELDITVGDGSAFVPLVEALPVRIGHDIHIRCTVPAGHEAALFWIDTQGKLTQLDLQPSPDQPADKKAFMYTAPHSADTLAGPPGTEVAFIVTSTDRSPTLADVQPLATAGAWPELPSDAAVRFDATAVAHLPPGTQAESSDPRRRTAAVEGRATTLREALSQRFSAFAGVAFPRE